MISTHHCDLCILPAGQVQNRSNLQVSQSITPQQKYALARLSSLNRLFGLLE